MKSRIIIDIETKAPKLYLKEQLYGKELRESRKEFEEDFHNEFYEEIRRMISESDDLEDCVCEHDISFHKNRIGKCDYFIDDIGPDGDEYGGICICKKFQKQR